MKPLCACPQQIQVWHPWVLKFLIVRVKSWQLTLFEILLLLGYVGRRIFHACVFHAQAFFMHTNNFYCSLFFPPTNLVLNVALTRDGSFFSWILLVIFFYLVLTLFLFFPYRFLLVQKQVQCVGPLKLDFIATVVAE